MNGPYHKNTKITDVIHDPVFSGYGRLLFPVAEEHLHGETLRDLEMTYYNHIDPDKTVEVLNFLKSRAASGEQIFYDIYTDEENAADPAKKDTGLFYFKGKPGAKTAICCAGGAFIFVGAIHDSFPHALELMKNGYNALALIYRPGADNACKDLARAIRFVFEHAKELEVDTDCYSLWGGSAGARMVAFLGNKGTAAYGEPDLPRAGAVIMQYTAHTDYSKADPPTYVCVGKKDWVVDWKVMEKRINAMSSLGIETEFHAYDELPHGFGLGTGTDAEGWFDEALALWERQMR